MKMLSEVLRAEGKSEDDVRAALTGTIEKFMERKLDKPITYTFDAKQYENIAEAKASEDWPGQGDILKIVNRNKITSAKAQAYQKETVDLRKEYENGPDYKRKTLIDAAVLAGFSQAEAEALAASKLG